MKLLARCNYNELYSIKLESTRGLIKVAWLYTPRLKIYFTRIGGTYFVGLILYKFALTGFLASQKYLKYTWDYHCKQQLKNELH